MLQRLIICGLIVGMAVAFGGCYGSGIQSRATQVGPNGFDISVDGVHISAGPGVAPNGTTVEVAVTKDPGSLPDVPHVTSASTVAQVSLNGGRQQPQVPISITVPVAASLDVKAKLAAGDQPVIVAKGTKGDIELLDAQWDPDARTLTAQAGHLSGFFAAFIEAGKALQAAGKFVNTLFGQQFPKPDCGSKASNSGTDYAVSPVSHDAAWPCIEVGDGQIVLSLHSNSGQVYRVRTAPSAPGNTTTGPDVTNVVMEAIYHQMFSSSRAIEGLLPPGGSVEFHFTPSAPPSRGELVVEPVLLYVKVLMLAANMFSTGGGTLAKTVAAADVVDCLGGLGNTWKGIDIQQLMASLGQNLKVVGDCMGPAIVAQGQKQVLDKIIGLIISGPALLTTMVKGFINSIGQLFGQDTANDATFSVTTSGTGKPPGTGEPSVTGRPEIVVLKPVDAEGNIQSGWVQKTENRKTPIACDDGSSPHEVGTGVLWCGGGVDDGNACWPTRGGAYVLCLKDPFSKVLSLIQSNGAEARYPSPKEPVPMGLVLDDGTKWFARVHGSAPIQQQHPDWILYYFRDGTAPNCGCLWGPPDGTGIDKTANGWTVWIGPENGPLTSHRVAKAYYVGVA